MKYYEFIHNFKILFMIFIPMILVFLKGLEILFGYIFLVTMVYIFELLGGFYK